MRYWVDFLHIHVYMYAHFVHGDVLRISITKQRIMLNSGTKMKKKDWMEMLGFEPRTFYMQSRRYHH